MDLLTFKMNPGPIGPPQDYPIQSLCGDGLGLGSGITTTIAASGWNRSRTGFFDEFLYALPVSATTEPWFGDTPWRFELLSGTCNVTQQTPPAAASQPGVARFALGANSSIALGKGTVGSCRFADMGRVDFILATATSITALTLRMGLSATPMAGATGAHAAYFEFVQTADTDLHCVTRDGGVQTADVDSATALTNGARNVYSIVRLSNGDLEFSIDNVLITTIAAATHSIDTNDALSVFISASTVGTACSIDPNYASFQTGNLGFRTT